MALRVHQALSLGQAVLAQAFESSQNPYQFGVEDAGILKPGLEARVLLALAMDQSPDALWARLQDDIGHSVFSRFREYIHKRARGTPVAYLRGSQEFFGIDVKVQPGILIPRGDTEVLVDWVLDDYPIEDTNFPGLRVHDCCTGSGCIPLALKFQRPKWEVSASDISPLAVQIAELNLKSQELQGIIVRSNLLDGLSAAGFSRDQGFDVITANPPYLTEEEWQLCADSGWIEPKLALLAGSDGLKIISELIIQARDWLNASGRLYIESGAKQSRTVRALMIKHGFTDIKVQQDLEGRDRITRGTWPGGGSRNG